MIFPDLLPELTPLFPQLRGSLSANELLAPYTWFRVGGPAQLFYLPADEEDLVYFLRKLPREIPVTVIGLGSNLIIRDGGVAGVVIRLSAKGFGAVSFESNQRLRIGAATPDIKAARAAAEAGVSGLAFFRGIPGGVGGALRRNAGAHGGETKDCLIEARGVDRAGEVRIFSAEQMGYGYRSCAAPLDIIFTQALFQGVAGNSTDIVAEMDRITAAREASQPIREKTGGSTFKNPPGHKAWQLIDAAGCRGLREGDAQVSEMHCNFLINRGEASAGDIERLGETVRRRVMETCGVELHWEIKRIGQP
ncbi:MAG: UDP-N-acetylmuramate dehydrogenase [Methylocystis sp.]